MTGTIAPEPTVAFRTCPLCEATCGLELTLENDRVTHVRGDRRHVFSKGYICPKGAAFGELVDDPDRLRRPLVRDGDGWREVGWTEAFAAIEAGLRPIIENHGHDAVGVYIGNPSVHTMAGVQYLVPLVRALRTRNSFSAATVDQMPKHVSCGLMFGDPLAMPVPDIDRTDFLLILGANPWESNGSLCTAADFRGRLKAIQARGGRFVVVDPRRTRTAAEADEHIFIRPATDVFLLFAIVHTLFDEGLVDLPPYRSGSAGDPGGGLAEHLNGVEDVRRLALDFPAERVAATCGIPAERIRGLARELAAAPTAAVYGRVGTCQVEFGTLASWLVDVINALTGNLDRPGGAMWPLAAHRPRRKGGKGFAIGRWKSRVRGQPETFSQLPVAVLAEEIDTPGEGRIRAMVTYAGNPVVSTPNSGRLDAALAGLDFMVSVDPYLNETTRHADVILPPTDSTRVGHYDFAFLELAVRNYAAYSPPVRSQDPGGMDDSGILARLAAVIAGLGPQADVAAIEESMIRHLLDRAAGDPDSSVAGRDVDELRALVTGDNANERLLDVALRTGAYGDGFGADPEGLSLAKLKANPHGVDLGPLTPRVPDVLRTASGRVELCPPALAADVPRLLARLDAPADGLLLVGRRHLRSNNSWMHNVPMLMTGKPRCTLQVHPEDATRLGLEDGGPARVESRVGAVVAPVEVTAEVMPGVVSLPHGWGHDLPGTRLNVAAAQPGVNSNILADDQAIDPLSGNAVLDGIPVSVTPALVPAPA
ncbi:MAG TPA: molybdopterin-dependent oxidoreductase [Candidatus Dormibacteraeota bacterium]|jgi:anaerobic selenocysteine-containing dehydrogenase|nr:molybdopterin-dependent oxidoreductase [Candidatus Dormibacteraeota bacterium]